MSLYRVAYCEALSRGQLNKIESYAVHYDWNLAFLGKSLGNRHLARVVRLVGTLWNELHESDNVENDPGLREELDIAVAGGLLHDIGLVEGNINHCFTGKTIARKILEGIGISDSISGRILHCIEAHDGEVTADTTEARLVHDADTIDKLGPAGALRHIWKLSLLGEKKYDAGDFMELLPDHLEFRKNRLYLSPSKELAGKLNDHLVKLLEDQKKFAEIVKFTTRSAMTGITVDEMLPGLFEEIKLDRTLVAAMKKQIELENSD